MLSLDDLGWSPRLDAAFAEHRSAGFSPARVSLEHTHIYRVLTPDGELLARVSGRLRHDALERADFPAVGDWVAIDPPQHGRRRAHPRGAAAIQPVLAPRGRRSHRGAGRRRQHRHRLSRRRGSTAISTRGASSAICSTAWDSGATPVIVLNKADLVDDPQTFVERGAASARGVRRRRRVAPSGPSRWHALREHLGRGQTGGAARVVGGRQVVDRRMR